MLRQRYVHMHDGYIMSGRTRVGVIKLRMAPTETQAGSAPLKDTLEIRLNKSSSVSFCELQLSVAIRPAFFMQINLTAQQSVSYASPCSLILNSLLHSLGLSLPSTSFSQAFAEVATFALFIIKG